MQDISRRDFFKVAGIGVGAVALAGMAGCSSSSSSSSSSTEVADTVVYGKTYTSNTNGDYAEAFAIKDGKFVYVGDIDGAKAFVKDGTTKVIDHRDKGLIMAGCTEGHGHYVMDGVLEHMKLTVTGATEDEIIANVKSYVEANPNKKVYYTFGWDNVALNQSKFQMNMRPKLDEICSDKPMMIGDNSGHTAFCNSKAFELAGVTKDTTVTGGEFVKIDGELSGLVTDMADNYILKNAIATTEIFTESDYNGICETMQDKLHAYGYTYYQDGWMNYFSNSAMDCLKSYDEKTGLTIIASGSHKIDSYDDWETEVDKAEKEMKEYAGGHLKYNVIKLFADGEAVESKSGWLIDGYPDGTHGTQVWESDVMNSIVKTANSKGISMHIHSQGDAATKQVVEAYINAGNQTKEGIFNGICHGRNITDECKKLMGENNIYASENINWRSLVAKDKADQVSSVLDEKTAKAGYPVKTLLDNHVNVSSSTDVPAASGAPVSVCGIIEVAVNGTRPDLDVWQLDERELVSIEEAMNIMTINGAKQLMIEGERGSIEKGKYADFVMFDKDISSCAKDEIHEANVSKVYFEGKEAYSA